MPLQPHNKKDRYCTLGQCRLGVIFDRDEASCTSRHVGFAPKAKVKMGVLASVMTGRGGLMMPPDA